MAVTCCWLVGNENQSIDRLVVAVSVRGVSMIDNTLRTEIQPTFAKDEVQKDARVAQIHLFKNAGDLESN